MSILDRFRKKIQTPDEPEVSPLFATDTPEGVPERRTSDEMIEEMFDKATADEPGFPARSEVPFDDQADPSVSFEVPSDDQADPAASFEVPSDDQADSSVSFEVPSDDQADPFVRSADVSGGTSDNSSAETYEDDFYDFE